MSEMGEDREAPAPMDRRNPRAKKTEVPISRYNRIIFTINMPLLDAVLIDLLRIYE